MTGERELSLEEIVDAAIDEIAAGRSTSEEALAPWPERRDELAPLLETAMAMRELPAVPERAPDAERRAAFMAELATTPQEAPRRGVGERLGGWLGGVSGAMPRIAAIAAPAAAAALVALFFVLSTGGDRVMASTLTVFDGAVERNDDRAWRVLADGSALEAGDRLRTTDAGQALVTFPDGSTAALAPSTELVLERVSTGGGREIQIEQIGGRIWNDVAPGTLSERYVVRTADATVVAHGTTFETAIVDGVTSVTAAAGEVEVDAGSDRATALAGDVVRADEQRIVAATPHPSTDAPVTIAIEGPFVGSLLATNGAATGALPSGVTYQQIPGVSTSDPGDGPQLLRFYEIAPGPYTLMLRRVDGPDGAGRVVLANGGIGHAIELPADLGTMRLRIDVGISDENGRIALALVDREVEAIEEPVTDERIVDTPRTTDAVAVADRRAALASATPSDVRPSASATPSDRAAVTATSSDAAPSATATTVRDRLLAILALDAPTRAAELRAYLEGFEADDARWPELRRRLEGDTELRQRFAAALEETGDAAFIDAVRTRLGLATGDRTSDATVEATPLGTPVPGDTPSDATPARDGG